MADKKRRKTRWQNVVRYPDGTYYAIIRPIGGGKRREVSLRTKKASEVEDALELLKLEVNHPVIAGKRMPALYALGKYKEARRKEVKDGELRQSTWKTYEYIIDDHLVPALKNTMISQIDHRFWDVYAAKSRVKDLQNHRVVLRHFLKFCMRQGWIQQIPLEFKLPKHERRKRKALTDEQILAIMKYANGRLLLFLSMYLFMAMRRSEIAKLEWSRVFLDQGFIVLTKDNTKTKKTRVVTIHPFVKELLIQARKGSGRWVFPNAKDPKKHADPGGFKTAWLTLKKRCREAGTSIDDITPHDLRATWTTRARKNKNFTDTQKEKFAGSSSQIQKDVYTDFSPEDVAGLEKAVDFKGLNKVLSQRLSRRGKLVGGKSAR